MRATTLYVMRRASFGFVILAMSLLFSSGASAQSITQWVGTWKANIAKSTYDPGPAPRSNTAVFDVVDGVLRLTVESVSPQGQQSQQVFLLTFDEKERTILGTANPTTRLYRSIDDRTFEWVTKTNGQVTATVHVERAPDGKTINSKNSGNTRNAVLWEKQ